jgi:hypothetical protein
MSTSLKHFKYLARKPESNCKHLFIKDRWISARTLYGRHVTTESLSSPAGEEKEMRNSANKPKERRVSRQRLPPGWDEDRVRRVLRHYENQTEDEAVAEDESACDTEGQTVMIVPTALVQAIRLLIARRGA